MLAGGRSAKVKRLDPNLPLFDVRTMEEHMQLSMFIPRMASTLLGLFGILALLLAVVGLYSVVAFSVVAAHPRDRRPHGARRRPRARFCAWCSARACC